MSGLLLIPPATWLTVLVHSLCIIGAVVILVETGHHLARMLAAFVLVCSTVYFLLLAIILLDPTPFSLYLYGPMANKFFHVSKYYDLVNAFVNLIVVWLCSPFGSCMLVRKDEVIH